MSNISISIKVVSQLQKLEYHGVAQQKESAAASRMSALLQGRMVKDSGSLEKNSISHTLYSNQVTDQKKKEASTSENAKPVAFVFKEGLEIFMGFSDDAATRTRKDFFKAVEEGKKALREKFGENIPKRELLNLAKEVRSKATTVWKHQIVTTRTESQPFEGSRQNKGGTYTATVKSKTIYTYGPLTDDQIEDLRSVILGLKKFSELNRICRRDMSNPPVGTVRSWVTDTGTVVLKEPKVKLTTS